MNIFGNGCFSECDSLTKVTITSSESSVGKEAFRYCVSLRKITILSSIKQIEDIGFPIL